MNVLDCLAAEHRLFQRLMDRLNAGLLREEQLARAEMREVLLVLLPALDDHEEIETLIFGRQWPQAGAAERRLLDEFERQHRSIEKIKDEIHEALEAFSGCPFERLKGLVRLLTEGLTRHFAGEERRLWPRYQKLISRSVDHSLARRALGRVRRLERRMRERGGLVEYYLGGLH